MYVPFNNNTVRVVYQVGYSAPMESEPPLRAGRPRSERAHRAILEAAASLLLEGGLTATTIEAIAARAHVSKVTIYKWWPSRGALAIDAYFDHFRETIVFEDSGETAHDLETQIGRLIDAFRGRAGELMAELIGQAQSDPVLAQQVRQRWLAPRREATKAILRRGIERGQIREELDLETVLDLLYAPVYYRLALGHEPLDEGLAARIVSGVIDGIRRR
jgi:AcrR family transcriptional regulator